MSKFLTLRLRRFVPFGLLAFAAAALLAPAANATPYVVKLVQQGNNVVATGNGAFDLTGLTSIGGQYTYAGMGSSIGYLSVGLNSSFSTHFDGYSGLTGPASFGNGSLAPSTNGIGDPVSIEGGALWLFVPYGYQTDTVLSSTAIWDNASFASLGLTPGIYVWTWGTGADQSFMLNIGNAVGVPEPAALGTFGLGLLLIGAFVGLRRRTAQAKHS